MCNTFYYLLYLCYERIFSFNRIFIDIILSFILIDMLVRKVDFHNKNSLFFSVSFDLIGRSHWINALLQIRPSVKLNNISLTQDKCLAESSILSSSKVISTDLLLTSSDDNSTLYVNITNICYTGLR